MHDRKIEMAKRAGGFVGLPGGFGTYEEVHTFLIIIQEVSTTEISYECFRFSK
jgi:predicted Rossmann-fold nucleotide-binding protein